MFRVLHSEVIIIMVDRIYILPCLILVYDVTLLYATLLYTLPYHHYLTLTYNAISYLATSNLALPCVAFHCSAQVWHKCNSGQRKCN